MKKSNFLGWIMGLTAAFLILSCPFVPDLPTVTSTTTENQTEREFLALLKTRDSHTVSEEQLETLISRFLNSQTPERSAASGEKTAITGKVKLDVIGEKRFAKAGVGRSAGGDQEEPVEGDYYNLHILVNVHPN